MHLDPEKGFLVTDDGVILVQLGDQTRRIQWTKHTTYLVEKKLGCGMLTHVTEGRGGTVFIVDVLYACFMSSDKNGRYTPNTIMGWLSKFKGDESALTEELFYAWARTLPIKEQKRTIDILDEAFERGAHKKEDRPFVVDGVKIESPTSD